MQITLAQQYSVGEKPTVILYIYINRHAGTPEKYEKQTRDNVVHLGGAVTETPDMSVEIARRTRACCTRTRRYSRELYGQPKVALSLKTRMV